jgi:hypothetical protein
MVGSIPRGGEETTPLEIVRPVGARHREALGVQKVWNERRRWREDDGGMTARPRLALRIAG